MNLNEIKEWRATLQASSHTKERIDALIGMVETVASDCADTVCATMDCGLKCDECPVRKIRKKYAVRQ